MSRVVDSKMRGLVVLMVDGRIWSPRAGVEHDLGVVAGGAVAVEGVVADKVAGPLHAARIGR